MLEMGRLKRYYDGSLRYADWDYTGKGVYFITINTKNRINYFGKPIEGIMQLSDIGSIACQHWIDIPNHFQNVELDSFIIMPDHAGTPKLGVPTVGISNNPGEKLHYPIIPKIQKSTIPILSSLLKVSPGGGE